jgi:biotin carboxyl carrier protein
MKLKVKVGDRFFEVEIEDLRSRPIRAIVDDEVFEVWPESKAAYTVGAAIRPALGADKTPAMSTPVIPAEQPVKPSTVGREEATIKTVRAPIPGVITAISVHPGDEVSPGQELCKLEAMKMNNSIRANRSGKVETIEVSVGQQVKHNEVLMEYAD